MKTSMKWVICAISLGLLTGTCLAAGSSNSKEPTRTAKEPDSKMQSNYVRSTGFYDAQSLLGTEIMNNQNQALGNLKDVVFNPKNGETFAAIGVGRNQCALVPWQALKISKSTFGKEEITLNSTKQALESGPAVKGNDWQELDRRSFAQNIYEHYNLQLPATGGVSHGALGSHSSGSAKANTSKS